MLTWPGSAEERADGGMERRGTAQGLYESYTATLPSFFSFGVLLSSPFPPGYLRLLLLKAVQRKEGLYHSYTTHCLIS